MRPTNVAYFEWIFLATLALGAVQSWLGWDEAVQLASPTFVLTIQILTFGLIIALVLLVSRRRSKVALWILVILFVIGLPTMLWSVTKVGVLGAGWITFAQLVGQCFALALMFTPSARAWLKREPAHA
jgi:hypothetical protein